MRYEYAAVVVVGGDKIIKDVHNKAKSLSLPLCGPDCVDSVYGDCMLIVGSSRHDRGSDAYKAECRIRTEFVDWLGRMSGVTFVEVVFGDSGGSPPWINAYGM